MLQMDAFHLDLGMVWCVHMHDAWDDTHLCYTVYLAEPLKRGDYYGIAANIRAEVVDTLEDFNN